MYRPDRFPGSLTITVAGVPALMTITGHPVLGAATMSAVLLTWVAHARTLSRQPPADQPGTVGSPAVLIEPIEDFDPDEDERPWVYLRASDW